MGWRFSASSLAIIVGASVMDPAVMRLTRQMAAARNSAKAGVMGRRRLGVRPAAEWAPGEAPLWFPCRGDAMIWGATCRLRQQKSLDGRELLGSRRPPGVWGGPSTRSRRGQDGRAEGARGLGVSEMRPAPQTLLNLGLFLFCVFFFFFNLSYFWTLDI